MKAKNSVKINFLLGMIIVLLMTLVGMSFAWFTDNASVDNLVLNFGKIELDLGTAGTKTGMSLTVTRQNGTTGNSTMMPGDTVTVKMSVKLKDDSQPAYYLIWLRDNDLFDCDNCLYFCENGNTYSTDGTTTTKMNADGTLGTSTITSKVGKISAGTVHNITFTLSMGLTLSTSNGNTVYAAKADSTLSETEVYNSKNISCKIYALQQANITEAQAYTELTKEVTPERATFVKGAVSLSGYTTVGFYKTNDKPSTVSLNSSLTSTYDAAVTKTAEKGMVSVYTSSDGKEIAFVSDYTIMAPADCSQMFSNLSSLTTINFNNFETKNVTNMNKMFYSSRNLASLNVSNFNTSKVTNMGYMFARCYELTTLNLTNFDTSKVTDMSFMFAGKSQDYWMELTSLDLSSFDTSNVTTMVCMFAQCYKLTSLDLSNFDTSKVESMGNMFSECKDLISIDLSSFDTSNVTDMSKMFEWCNDLTSVTFSDTFTTGNVTNMSRMFYSCSALASLDLSSFNTSKVTNMKQMFSSCDSLTELDLSSFSLAAITDIIDMLRFGSSSVTAALKKIKLPSTWNSTYNPSIYVSNDLYLIEGSTSTKVVTANANTELTSTYAGKTLEAITTFVKGAVSLSGYTTVGFYKTNDKPSTVSLNSSLTSTYDAAVTKTAEKGMVSVYTSSDGKEIAFVSDYKILAPADCSQMFLENRNITTINFNNFDTINTTNMSRMFAGCSNLATLDVSGFNTSNVENMYKMFGISDYYKNQLTELDVSNFNTSKVTNMSGMFGGSYKLTELDVSNFDTSKVTDMSSMFEYCSTLTSLDLSSFNTSNVTNMASMFGQCYKLTSLDLSNFDTSKVESMASMFNECNELISIDLSSFDTSNVTDISYMFRQCFDLTSVTFSDTFTTNKVTNMKYMFYACSSLTELDLSSFSLAAISSSSNINKMLNSTLTKIVLPSTWGTYNPSIEAPKDLYLIEGSTSTKVVTANTETELTSTYAGKTLEAITTFPTTWKDEINNTTYITSSSNTKSYSNLTQINFETTAPSGYTQIGTLSTGIKVYHNTSATNNIAFVSADTIYAPANCAGLFGPLSSLYEIIFNNFDTSNVTNMSGLFYSSNMHNLDLSSFNVSKVTGMDSMFTNCKNLSSITFGSNFDTSNVTNMSQMFASCSELTSLDLSGFDTSNVENMFDMFFGCKALISLDLSGWDTSKVTNMRIMFQNCKSLTELDLSSFSLAAISSSSNIEGMLRFGSYNDTALTKIVLPSTWGTYNPSIEAPKDLYLIEGSTSTKVVTANTNTELTSTYAGKTLVAIN